MFWPIIGFLAAGLTMFSFIPQIIKIIKTKSACDVSVLTLTQLSIGVSLWIIYGIHLKNFIIIINYYMGIITIKIAKINKLINNLKAEGAYHRQKKTNNTIIFQNQKK